MKQKSIWSEVHQKKICPKLDNDIIVDVLIIGGGITGISTAYHLVDSNLKVALVEKNTSANGVTSKTTGKLTYLQENIYSKLKTYHGIDKSKLYLNSQIDAIKLVKDIIDKNKIDCDLQKVRSYVFTNTKEEKLKTEVKMLKKFDVTIKQTNILPNNTKVNKSYYVEDTYVFHVIKYLYTLKDICLKKNIDIFENTKIKSVGKENEFYICKTEKNIIKAKNVVFATHYPYFLKPFFLPLKTHIEKSYIEAFKVNKNYKFSAINISKPTISTRYHTENDINYQLFLTNSHNTCIKDDYKQNFKELLKSKNNSPDYLWSNKDIITNDLLPFIGSINKDNTLLIGTGYNTWGMTNGSLAGKILADIILKKQNKYIKLFDPKRAINIGKIINFPISLGSNIYSFSKTKLKKQKSWYSNNIKFEKRNGKNIAIYIDENKKEHIIYNLCPHFKCSLLFNEVEKTWDCPCHGSRFDIDGKCIEGPSNYDISYKE